AAMARPSRRPSAPDRTPARFRPRLEALEDRSVPNAGTLDPSFGTGGMVNFNFSFTDRAYASVLQPDGKVVVAGSTSPASTKAIALARFLPDGTLDTGFGTGGRVTTPAFNGSEAFAAALQADGKILTAGLTETP